MKRFFLSVILVLICVFSEAQNLRIVKDNINCTYGIKDSEGNWVVEANYILIEEYNTGFFRVRDEVGLGVFTPQGKQLLPCIHDQINVSSNNWHIRNAYDGLQVYADSDEVFYFYGVQSDKQVIYNARGLQIGSVSNLASLQVDSDYSIIVYDQQSKSSTYIDSTGGILINSIEGQLAPFKGKGHTLVADNVSSSGYGNGNARVVNRKGELVINSVMDRAVIDARDRICFNQDKKYGVISISGDTIIAPKYKRLDGVLAFESEKIWAICDDENRAGLMKDDGRVLVEPQYDKIYPLKIKDPEELAWFVEKDGRFGVLNSHGTVLIPMNYDQIYPIHFKWGNYRKLTTRYIGRDKGKYYYLNHQGIEFSSVGYDSIFPITEHNYSHSKTLTRGIIIKNNGKYGVLNPDGSELAACIYDLRFMSYKTRYLLGQGENLTEYNFSQNRIETSEWSEIASDGLLSVYSSRRNYLAFLRSEKDGRIIQQYSKLQGFEWYGDLLLTQRSDTREWLFFNTSTKKRLPLKNIISTRYNGRKQFAISTRMNNHGIIDMDGKLIVDTIYSNISLNKYSSKIWATKIVNSRYVSILLDSVGGQVLPNQFDGSFEINTGDIIVSQNQKKGLIDSKTLKWKIRPDHLCLLRLFDDYYYAGNEFNKKGILRSDGTTIIPIVYDSLMLMYSNCQLNGMCPEDVPTKIRWIVRKGNTEYLADQNGKMMTSKFAVRSLKASLLFDDDTLFDGYNRYRSFPVIDYSISLHFLRGLTMKQIQSKRNDLWTNANLRNEVLDTINRIWTTQVSNCNQGYSWGVTVVGDQTIPKSKPLAEQARRNCDCFQSNRFYSGGNNFIYQLRSIGSKFVTIDISFQNQNRGWDHLRGQAPPLIQSNQHINIIEDKGKARYVSLNEIFPDDDILMQEFIISLQKRDDLKLECSSLENMLAMINGSFSLSDEGVHLYLSQYNVYPNSPVELLIPLENISKLPSSKWIIPFLKN